MNGLSIVDVCGLPAEDVRLRIAACELLGYRFDDQGDTWAVRLHGKVIGTFTQEGDFWPREGVPVVVPNPAVNVEDAMRLAAKCGIAVVPESQGGTPIWMAFVAFGYTLTDPFGEANGTTTVSRPSIAEVPLVYERSVPLAITRAALLSALAREGK